MRMMPGQLLKVVPFFLCIACIPLLSAHAYRGIDAEGVRALEPLQPLPGSRNAWKLPPNTFETFP